MQYYPAVNFICCNETSDTCGKVLILRGQYDYVAWSESRGATLSISIDPPFLATMQVDRPVSVPLTANELQRLSYYVDLSTDLTQAQIALLSQSHFA